MDAEHIILTLTTWLIPKGQHNLTTCNAYKQYMEVDSFHNLVSMYIWLW